MVGLSLSLGEQKPGRHPEPNRLPEGSSVTDDQKQIPRSGVRGISVPGAYLDVNQRPACYQGRQSGYLAPCREHPARRVFLGISRFEPFCI